MSAIQLSIFLRKLIHELLQKCVSDSFINSSIDFSRLSLDIFRNSYMNFCQNILQIFLQKFLHFVKNPPRDFLKISPGMLSDIFQKISSEILPGLLQKVHNFLQSYLQSFRKYLRNKFMKCFIRISFISPTRIL